MDSVTQIALGASVAAACVPKPARRKAALIGAALGTLPDLDVVLDYGDPVANFTYHRGFSHSLFVLLPFSVFLWALLWRFYTPVQEAPRAWFLAISLALLTHPLLDAHTAYGTQLFWPFTSPPESWSTLFIIDPLYTLPLLVGMLAILLKPQAATAKRLLSLGLILSSAYLGWSWLAKTMVDAQVRSQLSSSLPANAPLFSTPTPFNTLLWRVVVSDGDGYLEGFYSVLSPQTPIVFNRYERGNGLLEQAQDVAAVQRLEWFTQGFLKAYQSNNQLVIADVRMGFEGSYAFSHAVAELNALGAPATAILPLRMPRQYNSDDLQFVWDNLAGLGSTGTVTSE